MTENYQSIYKTPAYLDPMSKENIEARLKRFSTGGKIPSRMRENKHFPRCRIAQKEGSNMRKELHDGQIELEEERTKRVEKEIEEIFTTNAKTKIQKVEEPKNVEQKKPSCIPGLTPENESYLLSFL